MGKTIDEQFDKVIDVAKFKCEGKDKQGKPAIKDPNKKPFVALRIFENGDAIPLCPRLVTYNDKRLCNPFSEPISEQTYSRLENCSYYQEF